MKPSTLRLIALSMAAAIPLGAQAITVTQCGPNVCFTYDDAQNTGLFGAPELIGDNMRFIPPSFRAESAGAAALPTTTSAFFLFDNVYAATGATVEIGTVQVVEAGDYSISGDTSGAPDTVQANLKTWVGNNASAETVLDSVFFNAAGNSGGSQVWALLGNTLDPATAFASSAHDVKVKVTNTLTANTDEVGGDAWIQKKFVLQVGTTAPVPVPAAVWLFGSALGGLALRRKRRVA